jgi:hypothetical protein
MYTVMHDVRTLNTRIAHLVDMLRTTVASGTLEQIEEALGCGPSPSQYARWVPTPGSAKPAGGGCPSSDGCPEDGALA